MRERKEVSAKIKKEGKGQAWRGEEYTRITSCLSSHGQRKRTGVGRAGKRALPLVIILNEVGEIEPFGEQNACTKGWESNWLHYFYE